jgi:hypothetical protein
MRASHRRTSPTFLPLFAHNKKSPDGEVGRYSSALALEAKHRKRGYVSENWLPAGVERMTFQDALETEIMII